MTVTATAASLPGLSDGTVRLVGDELPGEESRWDAYLPAPTAQSHAANLAFLPDGTLGCVWFGGTQEGVADISVYYSRLPPGADQWSEPTRLSDDRGRSEQNPILFTAPAGDVWLLYTAQFAGNQDTSEVRCRVSADGGRSFGPMRVLLQARPDGGVFVRQPPLIMPDGRRLLLPVFDCVRVPGERWSGDADTSAVYTSTDCGGSWARTEVPDSLGCVHMNLIALSDGSIVALYRSRWADFIHASRSHDGGRTFTAPTPTSLPNNNSSIQAIALRDGRIALVFNNSSALDATDRRMSLYDEIDDDGLTDKAGERAPQITGAGAGSAEVGRRRAFWGAPRAPMTLAVSADGGRSWPLQRDLEVGDGYCMTNNSRDGLNREFSYPSIAQGPDGDLHIAFTYFRQAIKYVRVPLGWVESGSGRTASNP